MSKLKIISLYVLFFISLELVCRFAILSYSNPGYAKGENTDHYPHVITPSPHKGLVFSLRKNLDIFFRRKKFTTNSLGFRGNEIPNKTSKFRIVGIGDSVMMGWGVSDTDTYLNQLEIGLNKSGYDVETINLATMGYNTTQEYYLLKEYGVELRPDLVILNFVGNDYEQISYVTKVKNLKWNSPVYTLNALQFGFTLLTGDYDKDFRYELRPIIQPNDFEDVFFKSLINIIDLCKLYDVPLLVVLDSRYVSEHAKHSDVIKIATDNNIEVINLYDIYRDLDEKVAISEAISILDEHNKKYLIELGPNKDSHPNELWHKDTADILSNKIKGYIKR